MAVMVMVRFALAHGHDASVRDFALYMLELNRRMNDVKVVMQALLHVPKNALAH